MQKLKVILGAIWHPTFANDNDAFIPELWAQESLIILQENMVAGNLVHRDFEDEIQEFGDIVNTRRPADFVMERKTDDDDVTVQDAQSTNVAIPLNQHIHQSFIIKDGESSKSFKDLVQVYLEPASIAMARSVDQIVLAQGYRFLANTVGQLGVAVDQSTITALDEQMNDNLVPSVGRHLIMPPSMKADLLNVDNFTKNDAIQPNGGEALRTANLGMLLGFSTWMDQNTPHPATPVHSTGAVNEALGDAAGSTVITVDGFTSAIPNGSWVVFAGDGIPQQVQSTVGGATPTELTILPGLKRAVVNNAVVTVYQHGDVDGAKALGFSKRIDYDGLDPAGAPPKGALVSFDIDTDRYGIIDAPSTTQAYLDRPLEQAIADPAIMGFGPAGAFGMSWHPHAIALITRPLATPMEGTGARSFVANDGTTSIRVTITYNGTSQGHLVTLDILAGVQVLNVALGSVVLGQ